MASAPEGSRRLPRSLPRRRPERHLDRAHPFRVRPALATGRRLNGRSIPMPLAHERQPRMFRLDHPASTVNPLHPKPPDRRVQLLPLGLGSLRARSWAVALPANPDAGPSIACRSQSLAMVGGGRARPPAALSSAPHASPPSPPSPRTRSRMGPASPSSAPALMQSEPGSSTGPKFGGHLRYRSARSPAVAEPIQDLGQDQPIIDISLMDR